MQKSKKTPGEKVGFIFENLTVNPDDYSVTKEETTINTVLYYAFVANDNVYSFYGGEITKEDLTTGEVKSIRLLNSEESRAIYPYGDYIYCCLCNA